MRSNEDSFCTAVLSQIRAGDTVWDIGANVGFYSRLFRDRVGLQGQVIAFEPAPACVQMLHRQFASCRGVTIEETAMGAQVGRGQLLLGAEPLSPANQLIAAASEGSDDSHCANVRIITGDWYWNTAKRTPSVIKIDVEGFEEEVLDGMVHLLNAPIAIERNLRAKGFQTSWVDWSHLQAIRPFA
jgi:FkbM family methyltransferase